MIQNTVEHKYTVPRLQRHERDCMFCVVIDGRRYNRGL